MSKLIKALKQAGFKPKSFKVKWLFAKEVGAFIRKIEDAHNSKNKNSKTIFK